MPVARLLLGGDTIVSRIEPLDRGVVVVKADAVISKLEPVLNFVKPPVRIVRIPFFDLIPIRELAVFHHKNLARAAAAPVAVDENMHVAAVVVMDADLVEYHV